MELLAVLVFAIVVLISSSSARLKNPICGLPPFHNGVGRKCIALIPSWSYKADTNECVKFIYGGCGGNENRFPTKERCEQVCKL